MPAPRTTCTLLLRENGTAELLDGAGEQRWASDSDEDFLEQWSGTTFLQESDIPELLNYLIDVGELTEREADRCLIEEDSLAEEDPEHSESSSGEDDDNDAE